MSEMTLEEAVREAHDQLEYVHAQVEPRYADKGLVDNAHAAIDRIAEAAAMERAEAAREARKWCAEKLRHFSDGWSTKPQHAEALYELAARLERGPEPEKEGESDGS